MIANSVATYTLPGKVQIRRVVALLVTVVLGLLLGAGARSGFGLALDGRWTDLHAL